VRYLCSVTDISITRGRIILNVECKGVNWIQLVQDSVTYREFLGHLNDSSQEEVRAFYDEV
jgi:hypothetical protein